VLVFGDPEADIENHARISAHDLLERLLTAILHELGKKLLPVRRQTFPVCDQCSSAITDGRPNQTLQKL
jgi:hypothetical protein